MSTLCPVETSICARKSLTSNPVKYRYAVVQAHAIKSNGTRYTNFLFMSAAFKIVHLVRGSGLYMNTGLLQCKYFQRYDTLVKFLENGPSTDSERIKVKNCIRPLLESYLRRKFPSDFS